MPEIRPGTAHLAIASPPFTNQPDGKTLDKNNYISFVSTVLSEIFRTLIPGGFLVTVNTDLRDHARYNRGDRGFEGRLWQKHADIRIVAESLGFRCVETKIWAKSLTRSVYRYTFSYVQFFQRPSEHYQKTLRKNVETEFAPDVWLLEKGTIRRNLRGFVFRDAIHPEIVRRCLNQFTSVGDLIVCPFTGSGTVLSVANLMKRRCIGFETNLALRNLITESIRTPEHFPAYTSCIQRCKVEHRPRI